MAPKTEATTAADTEANVLAHTGVPDTSSRLASVAGSSTAAGPTVASSAISSVRSPETWLAFPLLGQDIPGTA